MRVPNQFREKDGILGSDNSIGNNGFFVIPHPKISNYFINCMASNGMGWEHVSVSLSKTVEKEGRAIKTAPGKFIRNKWKENEKVERCPTWEEMCFVKSMFWDSSETVIQFHPPEEEYVNNHKFCLHLWRSLEQDILTPPSVMVGIKQ